MALSPLAKELREAMCCRRPGWLCPAGLFAAVASRELVWANPCSDPGHLPDLPRICCSTMAEPA